MRNQSGISLLIRILSAFMLAVLLASCGGGGGGASGGCTVLDPGRDPALPGCGVTSTPGTTPGSTAQGTLALALSDSAGATINTVAVDRSGTLRAQLKDSKGNALPNVTVVFVTTDKSVQLVPAAGSALTDANGIASVGLPAGTEAGAFVVTASTTIAGSAISATLSYAVSTPAAVNKITMSLLDAAGKPTTQVSPSAATVVQAVLTDAKGSGIANVAITFSSSDPTAVLLPASGTALTDASGKASIGLQAGTQSGGYTITARTTVAAAPVTANLGYAVATPASVNKITMSLLDGSGAPASQVSLSAPGTVQALVTDSKGAGLPNVPVIFTSTDSSAVLQPASGSALTDASGKASIGVLAGTQAGAYTLTANATVAGAALSATVGYGVGTPSPLPQITLSLRDGSGAATSSVTPEQSAIMQAVVTDGKGLGRANVQVTFRTSDSSAALVPASGTALTDATGRASVTLQAGTVTGAFTASVAANVDALTVINSASYAVSFKPITLSAMTISPATLSAGGNASVSLSVLSGGALYTSPLPVTFTSPCIVAGRASIGSPVMSQAGLAVASYTDKGCGVADVITASVSMGSTSTTQTGTITVLPASAGSIKFVNAQTTNIALKGTGGFGRPEFSTLTFQVFDTTGAAVAGKLIDFMFSNTMTGTGTGGLTLSPTSATSAADGTVTTLVTAGTIPTSVRVVAQVRGASPMITTLSNVLAISTGVADQAHFSLSTSIGNCEGRDYDQSCTVVTASLGDHFGNPVSDGTTVNFSTESGTIGASCVTGSLLLPGTSPGDTTSGLPNNAQTTNSAIGPGSGRCSVEFRSGSPRKADGRVTVLAYALGEETLVDTNGNNVYDSGDSYLELSPDIFRDDDENGVWSSGEPCIGPNTNGSCSTPGDGKYNGVLRSPQQASPQTQYVSAQLVEIFSGSNAFVTFSPAAPTCSANLTADVLVTVRDVVGNIMPAGTTLDFGALFGALATTVFPSQIKVPNVVVGVGQAAVVPSYLITVGCPSETSRGKLIVTVTTPKGVISTANVNIN